MPADGLGFPEIPGVTYSGSYNPLRLADHRSLPPMYGDAYTVLVGRVDADGNMVDGVRQPNLAAPVGTFTEADRGTAGDPRPPLEARYADHAAYVDAVSAAARALVESRLLLPDDAETIVERARAAGSN